MGCQSSRVGVVEAYQLPLTEYYGKEAQKLIGDPIQLEHAAVKVAHTIFNQKQEKYTFEEAKVFLLATDSSFLKEKTYTSDEIKRELIFHLIRQVGTYERYLINNNEAYFDKHLSVVQVSQIERRTLMPDSEKDQIFSCKSQVKQNYVINKKSLLLA